MVVETYKYFIADSNLRPEYGGGIILNGGDTGEISKETLCIRYLCNKLNLPVNYTQYLVHVGIATGSITYIRVPDTLYSTIYPYLTDAEKATEVSTAPSGFSVNSTVSKFQPRAKGKTIIVRGDSISDGTSMGVANGTTVNYAKLGLDLLSGETSTVFEAVTGGAAYKEFNASYWKLNNYALGGSSWGNTVMQGVVNNGEHLYPRREDLGFNQRTKTQPLNANASNILFFYWLGTNDIDYDVSLTGANVWARAVNRITAFKACFPNVRLMLGTAMKRFNGGSPDNDRINDYNTLMRTNFKRVGVTALSDFEGLVSQVNIIDGDTNNTLYYTPNGLGATDGTHVTALTHTLLAPVFRDAVNAAFAITLPPNPVLAVPTPTSTTIPLSWTMSDDTNIIDYDICYQVSNSDTWITFSDGVSTAKTATLTGLTSGTSYDVMVKAVRSVGSPTPVVDVSFSNVRTVTTA